MGASGGGRGFVHVGRGHHGHGLKHLGDGAADAPGRDAPVGHQNGLALDDFQNLLERLRLHAKKFPLQYILPTFKP